MHFQHVHSGSPWEKTYGYCRAVRAGHQIFFTGTAPVAEGGGVFAPGDAGAQTRRCYEIIERALAELSASKFNIVRSRMYVTDISRADEYGLAHAAFFGEHHPCLTMVEVSRLIDPAMLVEIECDAVRD